MGGLHEGETVALNLGESVDDGALVRPVTRPTGPGKSVPPKNVASNR